MTTESDNVLMARRGILRLAAAAAAALVTTALSGSGALADTRPAARVPATVSADALPTVQVDGVVWSQAVVGTTVYAGGQFTTARPAGAAPGTRTVARSELLAYDIRTGALVPSFAPKLNGQVLAVVPSPDRKRIYVAGEFTTVNGHARQRIAAFDTATGALVASFAPALDFRARALAVTGTTVYVGGAFSTANGLRRSRLAAFSAANGHLLSWAPAADGQVLSMVLAPGGHNLVLGGQFTTLAGHAAYGLGAVDPTTATVRPFAANSVVRDAGPNAGITSLSTDGVNVYGTGYVFGPGGNVEGAFAVSPTGALVWLEDCHGDTYGAAPVAGVLYTVGHAHACATLGGFPETTPRSYHRAVAFTTTRRGVLAHNPEGHYADFAGRPAPALLTWFPDLAIGTYTHQSQAAWTVTATAGYVLLGGEFTAVNGTKQQGLVRFAVSSLAPNKQGPMAAPAALAITPTALAPDRLQLRWRTTWDRDNERLSYVVHRSGTAAPVYSGVFGSHPWRLAVGGFTDTTVLPGHSYTYQLTVTDPFGNSRSGPPVTATLPQ